jgi:hypothetical protein
VIRAAGLLAVAASVAFAILLACYTHSVELSGQVSDLQQLKESIHFTNVSDPDPGSLYLQSHAVPDNNALDPLGIDRITKASFKFGEILDSRWISYWIVELPEGPLKAAKAGDDLRIRSKGLTLPILARDPIAHRRYEIRRGSESQYFDDPGNGKFILLWILGVGSPLFLWGVAVGIAALSGTLTKRTATPSPDGGQT